MPNKKITKNNRKSLKKTIKRSKVNRNIKGGGSSDKDTFIFPSQNVSTQPNEDINYKEIGIIHVTDSAAVNALKGFATGVANIFGSKGFDNSVYDRARNSALAKLMRQINKDTQKICNLRMDIDNGSESSLFFVHIYGTLLEKKK
jgi:hypothetical protein